MYNFSTNPQQALPLLGKATGLLRQVAEEGPSAEAFSKAREYLMKQHQDYKGSDAYWMAALTDYARYADHTTLGTGEALQEVTPKDVQEVFLKTIPHRLLLSSHAESSGVTPEQILRDILGQVSAPGAR